MAAAVRAGETLKDVFWAALMVSGSVTCAEHAVSRGIDAVCELESANDGLLGEAVRCGERSVAEVRLPSELQKVIELAPRLRRSFVLRVLVGLPVARCAGILGIAEDQVNTDTRQAFIELAKASVGESLAAGVCSAFA